MVGLKTKKIIIRRFLWKFVPTPINNLHNIIYIQENSQLNHPFKMKTRKNDTECRKSESLIKTAYFCYDLFLKKILKKFVIFYSLK